MILLGKVEFFRGFRDAKFDDLRKRVVRVLAVLNVENHDLRCF